MRGHRRPEPKIVRQTTISPVRCPITVAIAGMDDRDLDSHLFVDAVANGHGDSATAGPHPA